MEPRIDYDKFAVPTAPSRPEEPYDHSSASRYPFSSPRNVLDNRQAAAAGNNGEVDNLRRQIRDKLSFEEMQTLKQCGKEAKLYRGLPFAAGTGAMLWYLKSLGYIRPRYFALKVAGFGAVAYFFGVGSYFGICRRRILELPNSALGQEMRNRQQRSRGAIADQAELLDSSVQSSTQQFEQEDGSFPGIIRESDTREESPLQSSQFSQLPPPPNYTSYDEIRRKNRADFAKNTGYRNDKVPLGRTERQPTYPSSISEIEGKPVLNKYGDSDFRS